MDKDFFAGNRHRFMERLNGGLAVIGAHSAMQSVGDETAPFEQEPNFWWLTGIEEPDYEVIIDGLSRSCWLVKPEISLTHDIFDGSLSSAEAARISGIRSIIDGREADSMLRHMAKRRHSLVYAVGSDPLQDRADFVFNPRPKKLFDNLERIFPSVRDCRTELASLRAVKQPAEVRAIQKAIDITARAIEAAKARLSESRYEYELEAELSYRMRLAGARGHAFQPIVAAGRNACTLHYIKNNSLMPKRSLVLIDTGARHNGFAADISRTFAVSEPTKRARAVHDAVELASRRIISLIKPGLALNDYIRQVDGIMMEALGSLGLSHGDDREALRRYMPHSVSHGLGVEVHDSLGRFESFVPGMVVTVEPGIYIPEEAIGVRIEDDILLTKTGRRNLSAAVSTSL